MSQFSPQELRQWLSKLSHHFLNGLGLVINEQRHSLNQSREKTQLQSLLQVAFHQRTPSIIKKIKTFLKDYPCFSINQNLRGNNTHGQEVQSKSKKKIQVQEIIKKDLQIFINVFSMYSTVQYYTKGQFINISGLKSDKIRILFKGDIAIYQPTNNMSFQNCIKKSKHKTNNFESHICSQFNNLARSISKQEQFAAKNLEDQAQQLNSPSPIKMNQLRKVKYSFDEHFLFQILDPKIVTLLAQQDCQQILKTCQVVTPLTPHRRILTFSNAGNLISRPKQSSMFAQNSLEGVSQFTSMCISSEVIVIELEYSIYKQILFLINNNEEKPYLQFLMTKFSYFSYFDALQYIKQKETMIDYVRIQKLKKYKKIVNGSKRVKLKQTKKQLLNKKSSNHQQSAISESLKQSKVKLKSSIEKISQQILIKSQTYQGYSQNKSFIKSKDSFRYKQNDQLNNDSKRSLYNESELQLSVDRSLNNSFQKLQIQQSKQIDIIKHQSNSLYFQLPFSKQPYLIVQGEVLIVINKISQYKVLDTTYASPRKVYSRHELLKLYSNDVFGIQSIGQEKQYSLRYQVRKNSKILKMDAKTYAKHYQTIPQFKMQMDETKIRRDELIGQILSKLSSRLENQMINKYWDHKNVKIQSKKLTGAQKLSNTNNLASSISLSRSKARTGNKLSNFQYCMPESAKLSQELVSQRIIPHNLVESTSLPKIQRSQRIFSHSQMQKCDPWSEDKHPQKQKSDKIQLRQIQFIGKKLLPELQDDLHRKLERKQKQRFKSNSEGLTVQLLKQFNLVDFKEQMVRISPEKEVKSSFIEMRNLSTGALLRRIAVPSFQEITSSKNHSKLEKIVMRKIGLLSEAEKVKHNYKVVTSRKCDIKYENLDEKRRRQIKRLQQISKSVPKLQSFFSKKANLQFTNRR